MLGFDAENPDVPARADETGALVKGKVHGVARVPACTSTTDDPLQHRGAGL